MATNYYQSIEDYIYGEPITDGPALVQAFTTLSEKNDTDANGYRILAGRLEDGHFDKDLLDGLAEVVANVEEIKGCLKTLAERAEELYVGGADFSKIG